MSSFTITLLAIGIIVSLAGIILLISMVFRLRYSDDMGDRLETFVSIPDARPQRGSRNRLQLKAYRTRMNNILTVFIPNKLAEQLLSANWPITESEYVLIQIWLVVIGIVLGWLLFHSIIPGIGLAAIGYIIPGIALNRAIYNRRNQFSKQLVDVLMLLTGAVRAGYSLPQSLNFVVEEMKAPASEEFKRVQYEVGLGLPFGKALLNLSDRMKNEDLYLLVTAININSQVGGNLVRMLESVTNTIRDRIRLFGEVRALTSQQRFNSYLLTLLPVAFAALLFVLNPEYIMRVFEPGPWLCFPIGASISVIIGNIVIRKLAKIDV